MNATLEKAKALLNKGDGATLGGSPTFALVNGGQVYVSEEKGIKPLMCLLSDNPALLNGASVADRITGRASAFLLIHGKVKELYTELISESACAVLDGGIDYTFDKSVEKIENCIMEQAVHGITDSGQAYEILQNKIKTFTKE